MNISTDVCVCVCSCSYQWIHRTIENCHPYITHTECFHLFCHWIKHFVIKVVIKRLSTNPFGHIHGLNETHTISQYDMLIMDFFLSHSHSVAHFHTFKSCGTFYSNPVYEFLGSWFMTVSEQNVSTVAETKSTVWYSQWIQCKREILICSSAFMTLS